MAKDLKYIRKRKRKYGSAFLVDIPFVDEAGQPKHFTETVRVVDFKGDEKLASLYARRVRDSALHDIESGKLKRRYPTVKSLYAQKWQLLPLSVTTREKHDSIYKQTVANLERKTIDEITTADIQLSLNQYAEQHSDDAVKRLQTIWRQIYKTAQLLGYDVADLTATVIRPKSKVVSKKKPVELSDDDFRSFLDALLQYGNGENYDRLCAWYILRIMYHTGMRPAEVMALTADDVQNGFISISKRVGSTTTERQQIVPSKTESSNRRLPMTPALQGIVSSALNWSRNYYIFATEDGSLWNIDLFSDLIHRVSVKSGIRFNAYMLRHKMSTDLLHHGDSVVARDLLGHTSFSMTLDYARSTDEQIKKAMLQRTAEFQPKTKGHEQPRTTACRMYQFYRVCAILRFLADFRGLL